MMGSAYTHLMYALAILGLGFILMWSTYNKGYDDAATKGQLQMAQLQADLGEAKAVEKARQDEANRQAKLEELETIRKLEEQAEALTQRLLDGSSEALKDIYRDRICLSPGASKRIGDIK